MKTSDFYFDLPQELIAQDPLQDRSSSRLLVLGKEDGSICHRHFTDIYKQCIAAPRHNGGKYTEHNIQNKFLVKKLFHTKLKILV